jgi:ABC-type spermidine/putrescine transport system permease subunit I
MWPAHPSLVGTALVLPALLLILGLFLLPFGRLLVLSVTDPHPSLDNYTQVIRDPTLWRIILATVEIAAVSTMAALALGYPLAAWLASLPRVAARILIIIVLLPFWTSILVRIYAWMVLLGREGVVNNALITAHLTNQPLPLLYSRFSVVIGMVHFLLPFMVLSLYSTMIGIDRTFLEASRTMGASAVQTFMRVYFPLSLPGVYAGCLLVFILGLGFYVTPALLGGPHDTTIAVYIQQQIEYLNWNQGTAMAAVLIALVVVLFVIYDRLLGFERLFSGLGA